MAAREAGTNREYLRQAQVLLRERPELFRAMELDELSLSQARELAEQSPAIDRVGNVGERLKTVSWTIDRAFQPTASKVSYHLSVHYQQPSTRKRTRAGKVLPREAVNVYRSWQFDLGAPRSPIEEVKAVTSQLVQVLIYEGWPVKTRELPTTA